MLVTKLKSASPLVIAKEWSRGTSEASSMPTPNAALGEQVEIALQAEEITESTPPNPTLALKKRWKLQPKQKE